MPDVLIRSSIPRTYPTGRVKGEVETSRCFDGALVLDPELDLARAEGVVADHHPLAETNFEGVLPLHLSEDRMRQREVQVGR